MLASSFCDEVNTLVSLVDLRRSMLREVLGRTGNVIELIAVGQSMGSALPNGSRIVVHRVPFPRVAIGDIVLFETDDGKADLWTAHRVVGAWDVGKNRRLRTKGDARATVDFLPVTPLSYIGMVVGIRNPAGGCVRLDHPRLRLLRLIIAMISRNFGNRKKHLDTIAPGISRTLLRRSITLHNWLVQSELCCP